MSIGYDFGVVPLEILPPIVDDVLRDIPHTVPIFAAEAETKDRRVKGHVEVSHHSTINRHFDKHAKSMPLQARLRPEVHPDHDRAAVHSSPIILQPAHHAIQSAESNGGRLLPVHRQRTVIHEQ